MLIRNAEADFGRVQDLRVTNGVIAEIGRLRPRNMEELVIEANGGAIFPGLHDHHIHLLALAASFDSVQCGPPSVTSAAGLAVALQAHGRSRPGAWIRGVGYHESIAGELDRC